MLKERLLVVDDQPDIRWTLKQYFTIEGYEVDEAATGAEAYIQFELGTDLVFLDHYLPDADGLDILREMLDANTDIPIIMLTGHACVNKAVEAMKLGAYHYAAKPVDLEELAVLVRRALDTSRLRRNLRALSPTIHGGFDCIIGESPQIKKVKNLLAKVTSSPCSTVLITGDSGTGKDLAAKAIHQNSERAEGPYLNITCSALTSTLLESELFGHERGAFTDAKNRKKGLLEHAHTGTVFLDEIGEMELAAQSKLLRFLEEKTFRRVGGTTDIRADVRVIAATNVDLKSAVKQHRFREDLYFRLAVLTIHMPPLRERTGDLALLVNHFVQHFNYEFKKKVQGLTPSTMEFLARHAWPGNVRELRNAIERAVLLSEKSVLNEEDFPMLLVESPIESEIDFHLPSSGINIAKLERSLVLQALEKAKGNKTIAASLLGMNRDQIRYRMEKFNLNDF